MPGRLAHATCGVTCLSNSRPEDEARIPPQKRGPGPGALPLHRSYALGGLSNDRSQASRPARPPILLIHSQPERRRSRSNPRNVEPHSVQPVERAYVEGLAVFVSPRDVVRFLGRNDGSKVLALGRQNPEAAWACHIEIAPPIDFHAIERIFTGGAGHIEK